MNQQPDARWGAEAHDWDFWSRLAESDLLPVVCRPNCPIASGSKLTQYGKVPSLYSTTGEVHGIVRWTSKIATGHEIRSWSMQPDYGICLQTRAFKALDVDVTDPVLANQILTFLTQHFPQWDCRLAVRRRANSAKFLILFQLDGEYGKRTLPTAAGVIEFLATGQQCLVAGTHPSGGRYTWENRGSVTLRLTPDEFERIWALLEMTFGTGDSTVSRSRVRSTTNTGAGVRPADPVVQLLYAKGLVLGTEPDGRIHFRCPWKAEHSRTGDASETSYFSAGTGGYDQGNFKCLHAHCAHRTNQDFLDAIGWALDGFTVLDDMTDDSSLALAAFGISDADDLIGPAPMPAPAGSLPISPSGRDIRTGLIHPTLINCRIALDHPQVFGAKIAYDVFKDQLMIAWAPDWDRWAPITDQTYTTLNLRMVKQFGYSPKLNTRIVREAALEVAHTQRIDTALMWADSLPVWDEVHRIESFYPTYLGSENTPFTRSLGLYQWTASAGRLLTPGCKADIVPVWVSTQGTRKTSSVRSLVWSEEHFTELDLSDHGDNIKRAMRGTLIVELSELKGLRGRDKEWTKSFVTRQYERWTPKYQEMEIMYPRRFLMIGTSNYDEFLDDDTGNRRWAPVRLGERQDTEAIERDRDQLWAEGMAFYRRNGVMYQAVERYARLEHDQFDVLDDWGPLIESYLTNGRSFDGSIPGRDYDITIDDILRHCLNVPPAQMTRAMSLRVASILRKMGYTKRNRRDGEGKQGKCWVHE